MRRKCSLPYAVIWSDEEKCKFILKNSSLECGRHKINLRLQFGSSFNNEVFYTLNKAPLGETACLSNLYYLLADDASNFLIHHPFPNTVS